MTMKRTGGQTQTGTRTRIRTRDPEKDRQKEDEKKDQDQGEIWKEGKKEDNLERGRERKLGSEQKHGQLGQELRRKKNEINSKGTVNESWIRQVKSHKILF